MADAPDGSGGGGGGTVQLMDLVSAATNTMNTTFIVLDKAARPAHGHGRDGREETCLSLVADETAAVHFLLWGAECDAFEPGDIVRLTGGIFSYHRGNSLVLRAGRRGRAEKVGEFTMLFVETPNMSERDVQAQSTITSQKLQDPLERGQDLKPRVLVEEETFRDFLNGETNTFVLIL